MTNNKTSKKTNRQDLYTIIANDDRKGKIQQLQEKHHIKGVTKLFDRLIDKALTDPTVLTDDIFQPQEHQDILELKESLNIMSKLFTNLFVEIDLIKTDLREVKSHIKNLPTISDSKTLRKLNDPEF